MVIGIWQLILILTIVLILFGSGRLPQVMSDIGRGLANLRSAVQGDGNNVEDKSHKEGVGSPEGPSKET